MGYIPPPRALTAEEFKAAGNRDVAFEKWYRYSSPLGGILWLWDWLRGDLISETNKRHDVLSKK